MLLPPLRMRKSRETLWSWLSPNQEYKTLIDYAIVKTVQKLIRNYVFQGMNKLKFFKNHLTDFEY